MFSPRGGWEKVGQWAYPGDWTAKNHCPGEFDGPLWHRGWALDTFARILEKIASKFKAPPGDFQNYRVLSVFPWGNPAVPSVRENIDRCISVLNCDCNDLCDMNK